MPDFEELLSKNVDEAERPKPLPVGHYTAVVTGHDFGNSEQKGTPYVVFSFRPTEPHEDVDEDELEEVNWREKNLNQRFYLTENAMFMLREFLENLDISAAGRPFKEAIADADQQEVIIEVTQQSTRGGDAVFNNINSFQKAA